MADFASMIYGTAQNAAQDVGQGMSQALQQGASLAMQKQHLDQQQQQMDQQKAQLATAKIEKLYSFIGEAKNYTNAADRKNYLENAIGYRNAMGLDPNAIPDDRIRSLGSNENAGRMYTLQLMVENKQILPMDALRMATDPNLADKFAKINPTPPELMSKPPDLSTALQTLIKQQETAREADAKIAATKEKTAASGSHTKNQQMQQTLQLLESARGNSAVQQAQKDMYAASKAKSLATLYGDPNKLSQSQVSLLVSEIGKIAQGGVPSMHELDLITPNTLQGRFSKQWSALANDPTPANAGKFVKQYMDYASTLEKDAKTVVKDKYTRVLEAKKGDLDAKDYDVLREQYIKPLDTPASKTISFGGHNWTAEQLQGAITKGMSSTDPVVKKKALDAQAALKAAGVE